MINIDKFLIGGAWVPPKGTETHRLINPATEVEIARALSEQNRLRRAGLALSFAG